MSWRDWFRMKKKPKISVEVETEKYDKYRLLASARKIPLSDWVREALDAFENATSGRPSASDTAFRALDEAESRPTVGAFGLPPEKAAETITRGYEDPSLPGNGMVPDRGVIVTIGHPCSNLARDVFPPGKTSADCQGSCRAQGGRPCVWPAAVARSCSYFRPTR